MTERDGVDVVGGLRGSWPSEIALPSARVSDYRVSREAYPAWKPNMPMAVALETLAPSSAISD